MNTLVIGSRGSELALCQTGHMVERLRSLYPDLDIRVQVIKTTGDKIADTALSKIGDKGLFVKEIEQALMNGEIDAAVHSAKDLPSEMDERLCVAAYPEREDPSDALISKKGSLSELPPGSIVGTGSVRRRSQILRARPDLRMAELRGNLDTRLRKLEELDYDAIILACAGLNRLGLHGRITQILPIDICLPAAGQGALAIQCRTGDAVADKIGALDHSITRACVVAERALLARLDAGCQTPVAALASEIGDGRIELRALVASLDGTQIVEASGQGDATRPDELGNTVADQLLGSGAAELLAEARASTGPAGMGSAG